MGECGEHKRRTYFDLNGGESRGSSAEYEKYSADSPLRPRPRASTARALQRRGDPEQRGPRAARRAAGLPARVVRRAPQYADDREHGAGDHDRAFRAGHEHDPRRLGRRDAAQPRTAEGRGDVQDAGVALPGPRGSGHRTRAGHRSRDRRPAPRLAGDGCGGLSRAAGGSLRAWGGAGADEPGRRDGSGDAPRRGPTAGVHPRLVERRRAVRRRAGVSATPSPPTSATSTRQDRCSTTARGSEARTRGRS